MFLRKSLLAVVSVVCLSSTSLADNEFAVAMLQDSRFSALESADRAADLPSDLFGAQQAAVRPVDFHAEEAETYRSNMLVLLGFAATVLIGAGCTGLIYMARKRTHSSVLKVQLVGV